MKKLSGKQKLIGGIAIILVTVIVAIVITTSIINNNNQVASEGYSATTANAGSSLVASYIKKGITIGGITGTLETLDTSDATAMPEDIMFGKTGYVNGKKIIGTMTVHLREVSGEATENTYAHDNLGNIVKVPAGFKVVNPEDNVTDGIVIEDVIAGDENTQGSQFVWVPVGNVITDSNGSTTTITLGRYTFASDGTKTLVQSAENWSQEVAIDTYYKELVSSTYGNSTAKDLEDFVTKALSSGGYYIGRYEAGDAYATDSERTSSTSDTNPIVSKSGVYPYTYITQLKASSLCQEMYSNSNFESDLINSYIWDTAIAFIQAFSGDTNYSQQRGRNTARTIQKCGESILDYNLDEGDEAQDVRCNIYDMAGNTYEWNTETSSRTNRCCSYRGGSYYDTSGYLSGRHNIGAGYSDVYFSARPILYL